MKQVVRVFCLALAGVATPALAVNGLFEINSVCAQFGCFSGDTGGLPVQITQPGSYRLTGNLSTANVNQDLIVVTADAVTIDLNGFAMLGPVSCSGTPTTCTATGTGVGIRAEGQRDMQIRNGTIRGMGSSGIIIGRGGLIEQLNVSQNRGDGIDAQASNTVLRYLTVSDNGGRGVGLGFGSSYLMDSVINFNGGDGVFGGFCGNIMAFGNATGNSCTAIAPNRCTPSTGCD